MTEYPAKITKALHEIMSKVGYVQKKDKNEFHGYKYAGEAALLEVLRPAMLEAGLLLLPSGEYCSEVDEYGNTRVAIDYTLAHKDGEVWPEKLRAFGCGNDKNKNGVGDKGIYKAITGANKYLLFKLFQIETGDDPENAIQDVSPPDKPSDKWKGPLNTTKLKEQLRTLSMDLDVVSCPDEATLNAIVTGYATVLNQAETDLPDWHKGAIAAIAFVVLCHYPDP